MRQLAAVSSAVVLLAALPASATRIQFLWEATGTDSITAFPGQEVVLQAWVTVETPSIELIAVSSLATPGILEAVGFEVCPLAPGNAAPGSCATSLGTTLSPIGVSSVVLNEQNGGFPDPTPVPGLSGSFAAALPSLEDTPPAEGAFVLAEITYSVAGFGFAEVLPYYREGVDGAVEVGNEYLLPLADGADLFSGVTLRAVPEPATAGSLLLGLLGIALARRGSRRRA